MNRMNYIFSVRFFTILFLMTVQQSINGQVAPLPAQVQPGKKVNYVRTFTSTIPEKNPNVIVSKASELGGGVLENTQYLDGLNRIIQQNDKNASQEGDGTGNPWVTARDIISINRYDFDASQQANIKNLEYMPFPFKGTGTDYTNGFLSAGFQLQQSFWQSEYPGENYYYNETRTERSPLGRVEKSLGQGSAFVGANIGVSVVQELSNINENVMPWRIESASAFTPPLTSIPYSTGKLFKTISIDEKGKKTYTYTDFGGKTILKKVQEKEAGPDLDENGHNGWLCTYYVYDDLDQLRVIITPKAVKYLQSSGFVFSSVDVYQELCFWYDYDERGRNIVKHSPGAGTIQMVYDNRDRLVLSQDENQRNRAGKQWALVNNGPFFCMTSRIG